MNELNAPHVPDVISLIKKPVPKSVTNFHVLVPLKGSRHCQPFKKVFPSNRVTAIIFSFIGRKAEVC